MKMTRNAGFANKRIGLVGLAAAAVTAGVIGFGGAATSQTVTPDSVDHVQHFLDCLGVLITDPDIHAAYCTPSRVSPELLDQLGSDGATYCTRAVDSDLDIGSCGGLQ